MVLFPWGSIWLTKSVTMLRSASTLPSGGRQDHRRYDDSVHIKTRRMIRTMKIMKDWYLVFLCRTQQWDRSGSPLTDQIPAHYDIVYLWLTLNTEDDCIRVLHVGLAYAEDRFLSIRCHACSHSLKKRHTLKKTFKESVFVLLYLWRQVWSLGFDFTWEKTELVRFSKSTYGAITSNSARKVYYLNRHPIKNNMKTYGNNESVKYHKKGLCVY